jgi:lysyl-tRNA synthetase class 1
MFKRIVGARNISIEDIPTYMDEFDGLEAYYFSKERDSNQLKDARLRGLYEYTVLTRIPQKPGVHVPYRQVAELAAVAPSGAVVEFVTKRLIANGAMEAPSEALTQRIEWAAKWAKTVDLRAAETQTADSTSGDSDKPAVAARAPIDLETIAALRAFAEALDDCKTPDEVQAAAFDAVKRSGTTTAKFFSAVYHILVGAERGPRLGPYVMDAGGAAVRDKILAALDHK